MPPLKRSYSVSTGWLAILRSATPEPVH